MFTKLKHKEQPFHQCIKLRTNQTHTDYGNIPTDTVSTWLILMCFCLAVEYLESFATG